MRRPDPTRAEAAEALDLLRSYLRTAPADDLSAMAPELAALLPEEAPGQGGRNAPLSRIYPGDFTVDPAYRATLPDLQNGPESLIRGEKRAIQHVGIHGFRLPIRYHAKDGDDLTLETRVTGTVSLAAEKKGINMSRIMRSFYKHAERRFSFEVMEEALDDYLADLDSEDARLQMQLSYPMRVGSLRSGLEGYQYYDVTLEHIRHGRTRAKLFHIDYVYSSTCPCSLALSEHARQARGQLATPHSQRSVARISLVVEGDEVLWFEDVVGLCRAAIPTETQVMVKREDEQAFAELNAANPIFVEDAVRLLSEAMKGDPRVGDYRIVASHQESLHSHDAISILSEGPTFEGAVFDPKLFETLIKTG